MKKSYLKPEIETTELLLPIALMLDGTIAGENTEPQSGGDKLPEHTAPQRVF